MDRGLEQRARIVQWALAWAAFLLAWIGIVLFFDRQSGVDLLFEHLDWDRSDPATRWKLLRNSAAERFWQPGLAFFAAAGTWVILLFAARPVAARWYPPPPPLLGWWDSREAFYSEFVPEVDFVDREERARLDDFLGDAARFRWWWVTGEGGVGKSRLVREWATGVRDRIRLGLHEFDVGLATGLGDFSEAEWRACLPRMPTVIVVEDAGESPEPVLRMIRGLSERQTAPAAKVRIVLVERSVPKSLQILDETTALGSGLN
ncbi:MAG: hypothetical protein O2905_08195 [Proteobacteria bacterium]|nr:hypothetical protein [Pseudomonadota bacterium]